MPDSAYLLRELLKAVSRSFYLTLRILPGSIRPQIGLAYLLARATDTVADTEIVSVTERLSVLRRLRESILGTNTALDLAPFLKDPSANPSERVLLERLNDSLALLESFNPADQQRIREVLTTIISGQELDLTRFGAATAKGIVALNSPEELDDYTYRVAGCVGQFWTQMCLAHVFPEPNDTEFLSNAIRFGKGLQLVNILRDVPRDLRGGRCYIPNAELIKIGLQPAELLNLEAEKRFRPIYNRWLDIARAHLAAGWQYTNAIPRTHVRVRLACAWPILIGRKTLDALATGPILDPAHRIKVPRRDIRKVIVRSTLLYAFPSPWRAQFR